MKLIEGDAMTNKPEWEIMQDERRNLTPHKPAVIAMVLWNNEYAAQRGGSMDFWDKLPKSKKDICREIVRDLLQSPDEDKR